MKRDTRIHRPKESSWTRRGLVCSVDYRAMDVGTEPGTGIEIEIMRTELESTKEEEKKKKRVKKWKKKKNQNEDEEGGKKETKEK